MSVTFCTVIRDPDVDAILAPVGADFAKVRHWAFKQIHVIGREVKDVKRESQAKFGITARHFNGIRYELDQAVNAWSGGLEYRIQTIQDSIEKTQEKIAAWKKKLAQLERLIESGLVKTTRYEKQAEFLRKKIPGKKQRLDILNGRLSVCQRELESGRPRICFGGRDLLRKEEFWQWRLRRESRVFFVGSGDEKFGNQSCRLVGEKLRLRLPHERFVELSGVKFRYGQDRLAVAIAAGEPITWLLFRAEDGRWHAHVTIAEKPAPVQRDFRHGVVAIDVNVGFLAVTVVNEHGNPIARLKLGFPVAGTPAGEAAVMLGDTVRALCLLAMARGYGIACEDLDFSRKKAGLREYGAAHARRLSGWAYAKFFKLLETRCARDSIELKKVNPAFTSVIGKMKYAACRAMSPHHAAALVIGRAALGYGERLVCMDGTDLVSPARMRPRTDRRRWRGVRRLPREGTKVSVRTAGSETRSRQPGSPQGDAFVPFALKDERTTGTRPPSARGAVALATASEAQARAI
jgi:IS605 OrfB family transposase